MPCHRTSFPRHPSMRTQTATSLLACDPSRVVLKQATNPSSWHFAEHEPGKPLTQDMVDFDTCRADVHVNASGVVHFYGHETARRLLHLDS